MSDQNLQNAVDAAWDARDSVNAETTGEVRDAVETALDLLDSGQERVAEPIAGSNSGWQVNQWLKKAVLLSFRLNDMELINNSAGDGSWWDKVPSKFSGWTEKEFSAAVARNPYNPKINMLQGDIYLLQGNKKDAKRSYEMAMKHPWFALQAKDKLNTFAK